MKPLNVGHEMKGQREYGYNYWHQCAKHLRWLLSNNFFNNDINSSHKKIVRESMTVNKINKAPVLIYEIKSMNLTLRFQHTSYYYHTLMLILNIYICKYAFLYEPIGQRKRSILCDFYFCNYDHHTCLSFDDCNIFNVKTSLY